MTHIKYSAMFQLLFVGMVGLAVASLSACAGHADAPPPANEICDDGLDNDQDLLIDCADADCGLSCDSPTNNTNITPISDPTWPSCAATSGDRGHTPVDIIWVVDGSFSMMSERVAIQENMNSFVEYLTAIKVDVRVTLLGGEEICVPEPLAGAGCANGERYRHIKEYVGSKDTLKQIINLFPKYQDFLRHKAKKIFIVATDDNSEVDAAWFNQKLGGLGSFSSGYTFHSIVSFGTHPRGCLTGAALGKVYLELTESTGGIKVPVCETDWHIVFDRLSQSIVQMIDVPCQYTIPALPEGKQLNPAQIQVNLTSTDSAQILPKRNSSADCAQGGWFLDEANNAINLCPTTCSAEAVRSVEILIGCIEDIG